MLDLLKKLLFEGATSPVVWALVVGGIMALIHSLSKSKSALVDAIMAKAVEVGIAVLDKTAPVTANKIDDAVLVFLKAFREYFESHGLVVTPKIEAKAVAVFKELRAPAVPLIPEGK